MKFYGQQLLDKYLFESLFIDKKSPGFFIEAGAYDGVTESTCKFFEETFGWSGINIEPDPIHYSRLINNRPNSINLNIGLGSPKNTEKILPFIAVEHPPGKHAVDKRFLGHGSCNLSIEHSKWLLDNGYTLVNESILIKSINSIIQEHSVSNIDLFVLDVEGYELEVIEGLKTCKVLPKVMCVEWVNENRHAIIDTLTSLNYIFHSQYTQNLIFKLKEVEA